MRSLLTALFISVLVLPSGPWLQRSSQADATGTTINVPDDFPRFLVPGCEQEMEQLRALFWLHYEPAGPLIPLWDEWMPMSTLWPARGDVDRSPAQEMRRRWATALSNRRMNAEGYVHTQQHDGPAHAEGWPFPLWTQAGGIGWHFAPLNVPGYEAPLTTPEGWTLQGAVGSDCVEQGWPIELQSSGSAIESPAFTIDASIAPWLRVNWWSHGLEGANCYVEWKTQDDLEFNRNRRIYFSPASGPKSSMEPSQSLPLSRAETRTMIPLYKHPDWKGTITGLRVHFDNQGPAEVMIKSLHTASDTRHNINNTNFIRGCCDYLAWSRDLTFLRDQIGRIRTAMHFVMDEFDTRGRKCVYTPWPGHEGRSGIRYVDGQKVVLRGEGIGSNYWDLLPFGGEDALATIYYFDALHDLAELEDQITKHPDWNISRGAETFDAADLRQHAHEVQAYATRRFWNPQTERFGTVDRDGVLHDYGFTFLNNEAVYYGFATPAQARAIHTWIRGERIIADDTSTGEDIYHWRFGPRSTTRRNIDYYFWGWSNPEDVPWGNQVQDGGAVLGFSYHDLMARLQTAGPDDAWQRLKQVLAWFAEVQSAGGYRAYYQDPARGTLQGGNIPGGLGMDREFFESILVPQVMLYGFLGFRPTFDGCAINPQLPSAWQDLTVTRIHLQEHVLDVRVTKDTIEVTDHRPAGQPLVIDHPPAYQLVVRPSAD